jgi:N-acetylneuraminic acid mutarotase
MEVFLVKGMNKATSWTLILLLFLSFAFSGLSAAANEVDTSVYISVPTTAETNQTIEIKITVQPPPQVSENQYDKVILSITSPNGVTDQLNAMPHGNGTYSWTLMINHLGNYTFQCNYLGEYSSDGTTYYKPSQSATVQMTSIGDPVPPVEADGGSWSTAQPMKEARGGLGVATLNGKIYAIGGYTSKDYYYDLDPTDGFLATNEEYDPATNTWTTKTPMPTARANFAIAACQGKIYCINSALVGFKLDEIYHLFKSPIYAGTNEAYDPSTDTWETKAPMPTPLSHAQANVVNGKIYIIDGVNNWMYNPTSDSWTQMASAPSRVSGYEYIYPSAVVGENIYFVPSYGLILIYNTATDSWSQGARTPRLDVTGKASAVGSDSTPTRIYLFSVAPYGWVPYGKTDISGPARRTTFAYTPETDSWSAGTQSPDYRVGFSVVTLDDKVYVVGGFSFDSLPSNNVNTRAVTSVYTPIGYHSVTPSPKPTETSANPTSTDSQTNQTQMFLAAAFGILVVVIVAALFFWKWRKR